MPETTVTSPSYTTPWDTINEAERQDVDSKIESLTKKRQLIEARDALRKAEQKNE